MKYIVYDKLLSLIDLCKKNEEEKLNIPDNLIQESLNELKNDYISRVNEIIGGEAFNSDLFFWYNNPASIFLVLSSSGRNNHCNIDIFMKKQNSSSGGDKFTILDYRKETDNYQIKNLGAYSRLSYLLDIKFFSEINDYENIIDASIKAGYLDSRSFISSLIDSEYKNSVSTLSTTLVEKVDFNKLRIHADKYQFEMMIESINNTQFSAELSECLEAYEQEKFYICAAGLGGVLEHLMYLTLEKNNMIDRSFPDNATYQDYVAYFGRAPMNIDKRQKTYIKSVFMIRNSVSHFNSGFTGKDNCQSLMSGIRNIYANYYAQEFSLSSIE